MRFLNNFIKSIDPFSCLPLCCELVGKAFFGSTVVFAFLCGYYNVFNKKFPPSGNTPMIRRI